MYVFYKVFSPNDNDSLTLIIEFHKSGKNVSLPLMLYCF